VPISLKIPVFAGVFLRYHRSQFVSGGLLLPFVVRFFNADV
jgi:hypothetical protein